MDLFDRRQPQHGEAEMTKVTCFPDGRVATGICFSINAFATSAGGVRIGFRRP